MLQIFLAASLSLVDVDEAEQLLQMMTRTSCRPEQLRCRQRLEAIRAVETSAVPVADCWATAQYQHCRDGFGVAAVSGGAPWVGGSRRSEVIDLLLRHGAAGAGGQVV